MLCYAILYYNILYYTILYYMLTASGRGRDNDFFVRNLELENNGRASDRDAYIYSLRKGGQIKLSPLSLASRLGQEDAFYRRATHPMHVGRICSSVHIFTHIPFMLPHVATCCHMLPHLP